MVNGKCQSCEEYLLVDDISLCESCGNTFENEWDSYEAERRAKRWENDRQSIEILQRQKIPFETLSKAGSHYRIGEYDFWATTGKFIHRTTKKSGRGVFNLIKLYEAKRT